MTRRIRPTDAFVDESVRGQRYYMGCVLVEAKRLGDARSRVQELALFGGRVHFHNESDARRRDILDAFVTLPVSVVVVVCQRGHGVTEFQARERCLEEIVRLTQALEVSRLVIESRQDDADDRRVIERVRAPEPLLTYEHRSGFDEPMLWVADGVLWAVGAGRAWRPSIDAILRDVVELRP